jgi:hypothetical protein
MTRRAFLLVAALVAACAGAPAEPVTPCPDVATPQGVVCAFYTRYLEIRPSGLPTAEQQAALAPWLSTQLERRLDAARAVQATFRVQHPGEKPPLVDGCLFASLFEGPTAFTVGAVGNTGDVSRVSVQFRYGSDTQWTDVVVVTRERGTFVIDDIEFAGAGPFNPAGRLSESLERAGE